MAHHQSFPDAAEDDLSSHHKAGRQVKLRSSAASIAARIGGAVQPVTPAKQTLIMTRP
jgi:hypothetical protein